MARELLAHCTYPHANAVPVTGLAFAGEGIFRRGKWDPSTLSAACANVAFSSFTPASLSPYLRAASSVEISPPRILNARSMRSSARPIPQVSLEYAQPLFVLPRPEQTACAQRPRGPAAHAQSPFDGPTRRSSTRAAVIRERLPCRPLRSAALMGSFSPIVRAQWRHATLAGTSALVGARTQSRRGRTVSGRITSPH